MPPFTGDPSQNWKQLVRVSQPMEWISNTVVWERGPISIKLGKIRICLNPFQTLHKATRCPNYLIPAFNKNLHKLHGMRYAYMFSLPKHPPDITIIFDDHHV